MNIRKKVYLLIGLIFICICLLISINNSNNINNYNRIKKTSTLDDKKNKQNEDYKKLMIVAHPDDETLWGGSHLLDDDYMVVCVTCGTSDLRAEEFKKTMKATGDKYVMLGYPDVVGDGSISDWKYIYDSIEETISNIIHEKDYDMIVTHNPDGDYGHIHHKLISKMVTENVDKEKLYYFGKYYSKNNIPENINSISKENLDKKMKLLDIYESQTYIKSYFKHMHKYENWIQYYDWNEISI